SGEGNSARCSKLLEPPAMVESRSAAASRADVAAQQRALRGAASPYVFRGMLVGMAPASLASHPVTRNQPLAGEVATARARTREWMLRVRVTVTGLEHLRGAGPFVYTPNHQSHLDILALLAHLPGAVRFAAKRSLWRHAMVGAVLDSLGMVPIDRENSADAIAALDRVRDDGQSFVVFPEGGRSRDG